MLYSNLKRLREVLELQCVSCRYTARIIWSNLDDDLCSYMASILRSIGNYHFQENHKATDTTSMPVLDLQIQFFLFIKL